MSPYLIRLRNAIEAACHRVLPARPVYVCLESEVPADIRLPDAAGWCGNHLDLVLRPVLADRWHGRRPTIVLCDCQTWQAIRQGGPRGQRDLLRGHLAAAAAHELAHVLTQPSAQADISAEAVFAMRARFAAEVTNGEVPLSGDLAIPWQQHDGAWLRLAVHAAHRLRAAMGVFPYEEIHPELYGLSRAFFYYRVLDDELDGLAGVPLPELGTIPPPAAFVDLWRADMKAWFASIEPPTPEQSAALVRGLAMFS